MNEPRLRFKADDESQFPDWEEKKFENLYRKNVEKNVNLEFDSSKTISIASMQFNEKGNGASEDSLSSYKVLRLGDIAFEGHENKEYSHGRFVLNDIGDGIMSPRFSCMRPVCTQVDGFWKYYIHSERVMKNILVRSTKKGTMMHELVIPDFLKQSIMVPSLPEQQKIADFLSTIDTVIEKQKETVSAWEERKKGMMQKLFSQEVRFKADDGSNFPEWGEKKLGDISERILVGLATTVTPYYREKGRPMFRNLNIKQGYLDDRDMLFLDDDYADSQKNKAIHFGDILTVHTGNIGWSCLVPEKYEGALSFTTLITTVKFNVVSNKYVCDFLNSPLGMNRMQNLAFSGGRANLNTSEFQKVQVPVPCLAEQQKIADCLSSLDEVIEKQKATLDAWEELKKGLLQQMFV